MNVFFMVFQVFLFVLALAIDAFVCSFSYGVNRIKIPVKSVLLINAITLTLLLTGFLVANLIGGILPAGLVEWLPFFILFFLGFSKIFEGTIRSFIKKHGGNKDFKFSLFNLGFILQIYADYESADSDNSKELSAKEAIPLAIALGLDGLSVGLVVGLASVNVYLLLGMSFVVEFAAIMFGSILGTKLSKRVTLDFSVFSGLILVMLAFINMLS